MSRRCLGAAALVLLSLTYLTTAQAPKEQSTGPQPVYLRVQVPQADAKLTIEDKPTWQTGASRMFVSPPLESGRSYFYTLSVVWQPNNYTTITRTRVFTVKPGQEAELDLREGDAKNPDKILVRYVPTPDEVVEAMCKLGKVGKDDVVYDLGCGDGRMVIMAVEKFAAKRGVGVDIDPQRIKECVENAKKHGVTDKVEFRLGDVLEIKDLSAANVILLYMGDDLNLLLRPILQKTLKPGSRIVSHRFIMGDWKPTETQSIFDEKGEEYLIHLWKIGEESK